MMYLGDNYTLSLSLLNTCTVHKSPYLHFTLEENNIIILIILIMSDFVKTWPALTVGGWIRHGGRN